MRRNSQLIFGGIIIAIGLIILISHLLNVSAWAICLPTALILVGAWILLRPKIMPDSPGFKLRIFGNVRKYGDWFVAGEETWMFIGDVRLDFSEAEIPIGETPFRVIAFIGDIRLQIPENVGYSLSSIGVVNTVRLSGVKRDTFFVPFEYQSPGYEEKERKIALDTICFIGDIRVQEVATVIPNQADE